MNKDKYIKDVLRNISADKKTISRIKEDLLQRIEISQEQDPFFDVISEIGHPLEVAKEFNENLSLPENFPDTIGLSYSLKIHEYKSDATLFGLPLVHINTGGRYQNRVAKGIVAIGDIAFGGIALGGVSVGVISFGGVSLGIGALGGVALGGAALGGIAVGGVAIGGIALGGIAIGAIAVGLSKTIGALMLLVK